MHTKREKQNGIMNDNCIEVILLNDKHPSILNLCDSQQKKNTKIHRSFEFHLKENKVSLFSKDKYFLK